MKMGMKPIKQFDGTGSVVLGCMLVANPKGQKRARTTWL